MLLSVLLSLAAIVTAFHIPAGQPEGVYQVSYDADGTENHTLISNTDTPKRAVSIRGASTVKRSGVVYCSPSEAVLNQADNGNAATELANQCGRGAAVGGELDYYSIVGSSVAYFCNFKQGTAVCSSDNAWASFNDINNVCGVNIPGWETFYESDGSDQYGYEWFCTNPGKGFCQRGVSGVDDKRL